MKFFLYPDNQFNSFDSPYLPYWVHTDILEKYWSLDVCYFEPGTENGLNGNEEVLSKIEGGNKLLGQ